MPRGVPKNGFRMTKNRRANGGKASFVAPLVKKVQVEEFEADSGETDAQVRERLDARFSAMMKMADATIVGQNRALIVSGPPGVGKSYGIIKQADAREADGQQIQVIHGFVRSTGLYKVLYENRFSHCTVVFDDSDSVFLDDISLNLLKTACDTTRTRKLHWLAESNMRDEDDERLPRSFDFEGSIIFITNYDFDKLIARDNKMSPHFQALISRSIYLDLSMKSRQDYMVRIKQVLDEGMLKDLHLSALAGVELVNFMDKNKEKLRELSLRMVIKLANLMKMDYKNWQSLATVTCFKSKVTP